jgi:predicted HicB family RNase H-like nuclease
MEESTMLEADKVRVRLGIEPKAHDELRVLAARSGLSMSQYCEALVMEAIRKERVIKTEGKK